VSETNVDLELLRRRNGELEKLAKSSTLKGGGGGGTYDGMEARVAALEKVFEKVDTKLDTIIRDMSYLKGKVDAMPSTLQLLGFVIAIFVAAGVTRYFGQ
jgi:hypothetical protein